MGRAAGRERIGHLHGRGVRPSTHRRRVPVWLSSENQFNYKAAYDLAVQTAGATLPVVFKFGTDTEPVYREFATLEDLTDFYTKAMQHIQNTLADGWKKKDVFDLSLYAVD